MHPGIEQFSTDIEKEPVIWFEGRAKVGPRALGKMCIRDRNQIKDHQFAIVEMDAFRIPWNPSYSFVSFTPLFYIRIKSGRYILLS